MFQDLQRILLILRNLVNPVPGFFASSQPFRYTLSLSLGLDFQKVVKHV